MNASAESHAVLSAIASRLRGEPLLSVGGAQQDGVPLLPCSLTSFAFHLWRRYGQKGVPWLFSIGAHAILLSLIFAVRTAATVKFGTGIEGFDVIFVDGAAGIPDAGGSARDESTMARAGSDEAPASGTPASDLKTVSSSLLSPKSAKKHAASPQARLYSARELGGGAVSATEEAAAESGAGDSSTHEAGDGGGGGATARISGFISPQYPVGARKRGEEGRVVYDVHLKNTGDIEAIELVSSSRSDELDRAALAAIKRASFIPARQGFIAVASVKRIAFRFQLHGASR